MKTGTPDIITNETLAVTIGLHKGIYTYEFANTERDRDREVERKRHID